LVLCELLFASEKVRSRGNVTRVSKEYERLRERFIPCELAQRISALAQRDFVWLNFPSAERHRDLIRARQCASFTDFVSVGGLAPTSGGVGMEAVVLRPHPHNPIAVDVDLV
jgi:hypothetical protein